jgi:hypothetical protein
MLKKNGFLSRTVVSVRTTCFKDEIFAFCPQNLFIRVIYFQKYTVIISLTSINLSGCFNGDIVFCVMWELKHIYFGKELGL